MRLGCNEGAPRIAPRLAVADKAVSREHPPMLVQRPEETVAAARSRTARCFLLHECRSHRRFGCIRCERVHVGEVSGSGASIREAERILAGSNHLLSDRVRFLRALHFWSALITED
jgi:hypothetical protein